MYLPYKIYTHIVYIPCIIGYTIYIYRYTNLVNHVFIILHVVMVYLTSFSTVTISHRTSECKKTTVCITQ